MKRKKVKIDLGLLLERWDSQDRDSWERKYMRSGGEEPSSIIVTRSNFTKAMQAALFLQRLLGVKGLEELDRLVLKEAILLVKERSHELC